MEMVTMATMAMAVVSNEAWSLVEGEGGSWGSFSVAVLCDGNGNDGNDGHGTDGNVSCLG